MKKKDLGSLKNKTEAELSTMAKDMTGQINKVSMEILLHKIKNVNAAKSLRRNLAQVLTIKREKELSVKEE